MRDRLKRLQLAGDPRKLASAFRKTLAGWRRSTRFLGYAEAREFGGELEHWLEQVERELLPADPAAALDLADAFVQADRDFFESADDSDGAIGGAVRAGCRLWLRCAARCEAPADHWPDRIVALDDADDYGAREELLRRANLLLDPPVLRGLVGRYEQRLTDTLAGAAPTDGRLPIDTFRHTAALLLLSEALQDPDVQVRATLRYSPEPNPLQKEAFVQAYLRYDRPTEALRWLDGSWGHHEGSRLRWQAQALKRLERTDEAAPIRQQLFEATLAVSDLHAWLELLPPAAQGQAASRARELASGHDDPVVAARLLLDLQDDEAAEQALMASPTKVRDSNYMALAPMAQTLEARGRWSGATVVYRALLLDILERGYTPAYRYAAKYWKRLDELASRGAQWTGIETPEAFEAGVRQRHGRKSSFWALAEGRAGAK